MDLDELFRQLSVAELSNLSMGNHGNGTIRDADKAKLVVHINDGIDRLHERFVIREKSILLDEIEGKSNYVLSSEFAVSRSAETPGPHYIIDDVDAPFQDDLLKILEVEDETGERYTLNVMHDRMSLFTPEPDILQIPYPKPGRTLAIGYQAKPVQRMDHNIPTVRLTIPGLLVPALRSYVAGQIYQNMHGQENLAIGMKHMAEYEAHCARVLTYDLLNQGRHSVTDKFERNGWV